MVLGVSLCLTPPYTVTLIKQHLVLARENTNTALHSPVLFEDVVRQVPGQWRGVITLYVNEIL